MAGIAQQGLDAWRRDVPLGYEDDEDDEDGDPWADDVFDLLRDDDYDEPPHPGGWPSHG